jgi:hypothetical protein
VLCLEHCGGFFGSYFSCRSGGIGLGYRGAKEGVHGDITGAKPMSYWGKAGGYWKFSRLDGIMCSFYKRL